MRPSKTTQYQLIVIIGAVIALMQCVGGIIVYQNALAAGPVLTRGQAESLFARLRNQPINRPGEFSIEKMDSVVDQFRDDGLVGFALYSGCGELFGHSSHRVPAFNPHNRGMIVSRGGNRVVYAMPPMAPDAEPCEEGESALHQPPVLVMTIESTLAQAMIRRGQLVLGVALLSALLTFFGAIALWRLLLQYMHTQRVAAQDKHLASLGEMSAVVAHELRNPLTSAKGNAQLLLEFRDQDEVWKLKKLEHVVQDLLTIEYRTDNLLRFVRSGKVQPTAVDREALMMCLETIVRRAESTRLSIETSALPEQAELDFNALEEILSNLVSNALDASDSDVIIRVVGQRAALRFEVCDFGPGLPDEMDVFEPFVTTKTHGTGLGLPVAIRLVEAHGGHLDIDRRVANGTCFFFVIPTTQHTST